MQPNWSIEMRRNKNEVLNYLTVSKIVPGGYLTRGNGIWSYTKDDELLYFFKSGRWLTLYGDDRDRDGFNLETLAIHIRPDFDFGNKVVLYVTASSQAEKFLESEGIESCSIDDFLLKYPKASLPKDHWLASAIAMQN
jgi:hypothetical protein